MQNFKVLFVAFWLLVGTAHADIYIYNTTDEQMTYQVALPNGDTKDGVIAVNRGYGPAQTTLPAPKGVVTTFKIMSESGGSGVQVKAASSQCFLLAIVNGSMKILPISFSLDNGQTHKREMTIFNSTPTAQTFDIIDEKEVRKGITLEPGTSQTFPAKNGFSGSSGFHHIRFANGDRVENQARSGDYVLLYLDKRSPGKVQVGTYGHLTVPRNTVMP